MRLDSISTDAPKHINKKKTKDKTKRILKRLGEVAGVVIYE